MNEGKVIGKITSGTVSPSIEKPIALAYLDIEFVEEGNFVEANIRGKGVKAKITKLPFIKT